MHDNKNKNKKHTFFIYDYETFGTHPASDRPAQFAGIRTNYNFDPISQPENFFCRLPNDYLPNPEAVILTEIDPMESLCTGLQEYKFAEHIHQIFTIPKTCILGYNNIRFDNEFSRNIFYRNFFDPYAWGWQQENSNWDLLHIIRAYYALRPEGIKWPLNQEGRPSFRLSDLSQINNITHNKAHDALSDVYATLQLAKLLQYTQPKLFDYLFYYRKKTEIKKLINFKRYTQPLIYIPTNYPINNRYAILISPLTWNSNNPNILTAYNLHESLKPLLEINIDVTPSNEQILHIYPQYKSTILTIHINKCPILAPIHFLRTQDISRLNIDLEYCLNNFKKLQKYIASENNIKKTIMFFQKNNNVIQKNINQESHVDYQLYQGFFNSTDKNTIHNIRYQTPETLTKAHPKFFDKRLKSLLFYYRARNFPHTLTQYEKKHWLEYRQTLFTKQKIAHYNKLLNNLFIINKQNIKKIEILHSLVKYLKYINTSINSSN